MTYQIKVMLEEGDVCGTSTNCATILIDGEKEPKTVAAGTIVVGSPDLKFPLETRMEATIDNIMYHFFDIGNKAGLQKIMDAIEGGMTFLDFIQANEALTEGVDEETNEGKEANEPMANEAGNEVNQ